MLNILTAITVIIILATITYIKNRAIACKWAMHGCKQQHKRSVVAVHKDKCWYKMINCPALHQGSCLWWWQWWQSKCWALTWESYWLFQTLQCATRCQRGMPHLTCGARISCNNSSSFHFPMLNFGPGNFFHGAAIFRRCTYFRSRKVYPQCLPLISCNRWTDILSQTSQRCVAPPRRDLRRTDFDGVAHNDSSFPRDLAGLR